MVRHRLELLASTCSDALLHTQHASSIAHLLAEAEHSLSAVAMANAADDATNSICSVVLHANTAFAQWHDACS